MPIMINRGNELIPISPKDSKKSNITPIKVVHGKFVITARPTPGLLAI